MKKNNFTYFSFCDTLYLVMLMETLINDIKYKVIRDYKNAFDEDLVAEKLTDYFEDYDYILGDYSYNSLRLKGFCTNTNKKYNEINDSANIENYIKKYCAYDCSYFILKKIK